MKKGLSIIITLLAIFAFVIPVSAARINSIASDYTGYPTFTIESVDMDQSVTIKTNNLPPNDTFKVTMGKYGTRGIGGTVVGTTESGTGGSLTFTYDIPTSLIGESIIAIRLESPTTGYFAYNWFLNRTAIITPAPTPQPSPTPTPTTPVYEGFPTFSITSVVEDKSVAITGKNFPANDTFTVLMGKYGTKGIGGTLVASTESGSGGSLTATYEIPETLAGEKLIAIRLVSPTSGYFAYNWFYNNTTP